MTRRRYIRKCQIARSKKGSHVLIAVRHERGVGDDRAEGVDEEACERWCFLKPVNHGRCIQWPTVDVVDACQSLSSGRQVADLDPPLMRPVHDELSAEIVGGRQVQKDLRFWAACRHGDAKDLAKVMVRRRRSAQAVHEEQLGPFVQRYRRELLPELVAQDIELGLREVHG